MKEVTIAIPHEGVFAQKIDPDDEPIKEVLLESDYDGPGVRMVSNQRFVPLLNRTDTMLQVRLIPRLAASAPSIKMDTRRTADLTFRLAVPRIAQIRHEVFFEVHGQDETQPRGACEITMYERYARRRPDSEDRIVRSTWVVLKNAVADDDEKGKPLFDRLIF